MLKSTKPEAVKIRIWITSEVLPSIRKTGSYSVPSKNTIEDVKIDFQGWIGIAELLGLDKNQSKLSAMIAIKKQYNIDIKDRLEFKGFVSSEDKAHYSVTEFAENFLVDCSARKLNKTLVILDIQKPTYRKGKINGYVVSREENEKYFTRLHTNKKHSDGTPVTQLRINKSLCELINNNKELFGLEGVCLK